MVHSLNTIQPISIGIITQNSQILVTQRPSHVKQGNLWEFPGGKREKTESSYETLYRELQEEVNLQVIRASPLITVKHYYADENTVILLEAWLVEKFKGTPQNCEAQTMQWVTLPHLDRLKMPQANRKVVDRLKDSLELITQ